VVVEGVELRAEVTWALTKYATAAELVAAGIVTASFVRISADSAVAAYLPSNIEASTSTAL
jgi:hypothetical protein